MNIARRIHHSVHWIVAAVLVVCMLGCVDDTSTGLITARAVDARDLTYPPRTTVFPVGDAVAVQVNGWDDTTVTIQIYNESGKLVDSHTGYIEVDTVSYWLIEGLARGRYQAVLEVRGVNEDHQWFEVVR